MSGFSELLQGYRRFRQRAWVEQRERYRELEDAQAPRVMVIACSDSRVDPSRIFDSGPGEIFILRNIANLVPPHDAIEGQSSVAAALEYAVESLRVEHIVVLGHARCGGVSAALAGEFDTPAAGAHVHRWMEFIAPARDTVRALAARTPGIDTQAALEDAGIRLALANLETYPFVGNAIAAGRLRLEGMKFDVADGLLRTLDRETGRFLIVAGQA
jgi:carbonic anhydrase